jgi:hypothetical protein
MDRVHRSFIGGNVKTREKEQRKENRIVGRSAAAEDDDGDDET